MSGVSGPSKMAETVVTPTVDMFFRMFYVDGVGVISKEEATGDIFGAQTFGDNHFYNDNYGLDTQVYVLSTNDYGLSHSAGA